MCREHSRNLVVTTLEQKKRAKLSHLALCHSINSYVYIFFSGLIFISGLAVAAGAAAGVPMWKKALHLPSRFTQIVERYSVSGFMPGSFAV